MNLTKKNIGYTLFELILVMVFMGLLLAIAVPRMNHAAVSKQKADTTAQKITASLRRARSLAISDAAINQRGYELRMFGSKKSSYTSYRIRNLKTRKTVDITNIDPDVKCSGTKTFKFSPLGNLNSSGRRLTVSADDREFQITITPATGMVKCIEK